MLYQINLKSITQKNNLEDFIKNVINDLEAQGSVQACTNNLISNFNELKAQLEFP